MAVFGVAIPYLKTDALKVFEFFLSLLLYTRCRVVVVTKLNKCRVPSSAFKQFMYLEYGAETLRHKICSRDDHVISGLHHHRHLPQGRKQLSLGTSILDPDPGRQQAPFGSGSRG